MKIGFLCGVLFLWAILCGGLNNPGLHVGMQSVTAAPVDIVEVTVIEGENVSLPCNIPKPKQEPSPLVLWYKDDDLIYVWKDGIGLSLAHWEDQSIDSHVSWRSALPSPIQLRNISSNDTSTFRCTINFETAPNISRIFRLKILELPKIFDNFGKELNRHAGPYEENSNITLTCSIRGGESTILIWISDNRIITAVNHTSEKTNTSTLELKLSNLTKDYSNKTYICLATAPFQVAHRNKSVIIDISYKPICKTTNEEIFAVLNRTIKIVCEVSASPPANYFSWNFYNTTRSAIIERNNVSFGGSKRPIIYYTPMKESDYGSFYCTATNSLGSQVEPCQYFIVPATKPNMLTNCTAINYKQNSIKVKCKAGDVGGLNTQYFLEVWDSQNILVNISASTPEWTFQKPLQGKQIKLVFYAKNEKWISASTNISITIAPPHNNTGGLTSIIILAILALMATSMILVIAVHIYRPRPEEDSTSCNDDSPPSYESLMAAERLQPVARTLAYRTGSPSSHHQIRGTPPVDSQQDEHFQETHF